MVVMKHLLQLIIGLISVSTVWSQAQDIELILGSDQGTTDSPVVVPLTVNDSTGIVGASFMVSFDTSALDVVVSSDFFEPFLKQLEDAENLDDADNFGEIDNLQYDSPVVTNLLSGEGIAVSGLRLDVADGSNNTLFQLAFTRKEDAPDGTYLVSIEPLSIANVEAGYPVEGLSVPALIGFDGSDYPSLLQPGDFPDSVTDGGVVFFYDTIDSDGNGLPDAWELFHFEAIGSVAATSDTDKDSLQELVEFFLGTNPNIADGPMTLSLEMSTDSYWFRYPMRNIHGLDYQVQWSFDGNAWRTSGVSVSSRPDIGSGVNWTFTEAVISSGESDPATIFARLVLDLPE